MREGRSMEGLHLHFRKTLEKTLRFLFLGKYKIHSALINLQKFFLCLSPLMPSRSDGIVAEYYGFSQRKFFFVMYKKRL